MNKPKVIIASADTVDTFPEEMIRILSAMGHPEALVTDESQVGDFTINISLPSPEGAAAIEQDEDIRSHNQGIHQSMVKLMGRQVKDNEYLGELARELYLQRSNSTRH